MSMSFINDFLPLFIFGIPAVLWSIVEFLFFLTHRRPLSNKKIKKLMKKRRKKFIRKYYSFSPRNSYPDDNFKSSMCSNGKMYPSEIPLLNFPSYTANLLKGKKHEWAVLAFVKNKTVESFYVNKGLDNKSVCFNMDISKMFDYCIQNGYQTIMRFHNHPNSNPNKYNCLLASPQDKKSAKHLSKLALQNGLNWIEFVCERGNFLKYYEKFSNQFYPENSSFEFIQEQNKNKKIQYKLQRELGIFFR